RGQLSKGASHDTVPHDAAFPPSRLLYGLLALLPDDGTHQPVLLTLSSSTAHQVRSNQRTARGRRPCRRTDGLCLKDIQSMEPTMRWRASSYGRRESGASVSTRRQRATTLSTVTCSSLRQLLSALLANSPESAPGATSSHRSEEYHERVGFIRSR